MVTLVTFMPINTVRHIYWWGWWIYIYFPLCLPLRKIDLKSLGRKTVAEVINAELLRR